ncbi:MAG: hypothetical protein JW874_03785 [Spirochaetales bacterium]|nr:hypothetical protein [Spirochaetales bacterium]
MSEAKKRAPLDLPLKIILTEDGLNFFIRNRKKLQKFRTADNLEAYGIGLAQISPPTVQQMMNINYVSRIEVSRIEFLSKRQEIMDISKVIIYEILYERFDSDIFDLLLKSDMIISWNRSNPGHTIDKQTKINDAFLQDLLIQKKDQITEIEDEILDKLRREVNENTKLIAEEKNIQLLLIEKFLNRLRPLVWFILSRNQGTSDYLFLLNDMRETLKQYIEKARIAEYISLMILELLSQAENANLISCAQKLYQRQIKIENLLFDQALRTRLLSELEKNDERLYLSWKLVNRSGSQQVEITIFNKESEYNAMKERINAKKTLEIKEKTLTDFYNESAETQTNTDLGLYYLSYLSDACKKVSIKFESNVHQIVSSELTVVTLRLIF